MGTIPTSNKQRFNTGFQAGFLAGILATGVMLLLSITSGGVSLPDALSSAISLAMPLSLFEFLHSIFGPDSKYYLFYIVLIGQCVVFALSGGLCSLILGTRRFQSRRWIDEQGQIHWPTGIILAFILWLLTGLIFLPLTGSGFFGSKLIIGTVNTIGSLTVVGLIFGLLFIFIHNWLVFRHIQQQRAALEILPEEEGIPQVSGRRNLLRNGLVLLGLGALGTVAWRFISGSSSSVLSPSQELQTYKSKITPPPHPNYGTITEVPDLSPEISSNDAYYVVSKNFVSDPTVDASTWQLSIDGLVAHPYTLTYNELMALPTKQQYESMMCISNEVGGEYMSNALWEGVPLVNLLQHAGEIKPGATKVVLYAADDYSDSIHLAKALEPTTLVATHMNNVTLPQGHGYPARLLVPGIYGMKHVKWITRIEVVDTDYQGYWQQSGWSDPAPIRMTSRIDTPTDSAQLSANKLTYIAGVAFSGNKGISEVDVSYDNGQTWHRATLKQPLSGLTWVLWELPWQPAKGTYTISVRAIDNEGDVQDPVVAPPLPNGSSGYHTINVTVA
ncbi:MAG TPA: molybdopterin-dependent oxidoreductase [Ktedonobacteraceae bacterium]|jgi:DMSO/TMAO reductase YedYZ molybdopterin-dependent catalytic subunit